MAGDGSRDEVSAEASKLQARGYRVADAGDFEGALLLFRKAAELEPECATLQELCAQCLLQLERWDDAYEAAKTAHSMNPRWLDAAVTLGRAARNAAYLKDAVRAFRAASLLDGAGDEELSEELAEVEELWRQRVAAVIGLPKLRIYEEWGKDTGGPGAVIWDCGVILAEHLVQWLGPKLLQGNRVLELGSGTGIAGIAAAACGAQVTLTDFPSQLPNLKANATRNQGLVEEAGGCLRVFALEWGGANTAENAAVIGGQWEVVMGSDLIYSEAALSPLGQVLRAIMDAACGRKPAMLMAHKHRSEELDEKMFKLFESLGFPLRPIDVVVGARMALSSTAEREQRLSDFNSNVTLYASDSLNRCEANVSFKH